MCSDLYWAPPCMETTLSCIFAFARLFICKSGDLQVQASLGLSQPDPNLGKHVDIYGLGLRGLGFRA